MKHQSHVVRPTAPRWDLLVHNCVTEDLDLFFTPEDEAEAKTVCRRCPAVVECLAYAIEANEQHGVWGGMNTDERKALRRRNGRKS